MSNNHSYGQNTTANVSNMPANGSNIPANGSNMPTNGSNMPTNGPNMPTNGSNMPTNCSNIPTNASNMPVNGPSMPVNGPQQHPDAQRHHEGSTGPSVNQNDNMMGINQPNSYGMPAQNPNMSYNTNYMGQNQPVNPPTFPQNQMHPSQGNYGNSMGSMGNDQRNTQPSALPPHMMGQSNPSQNQPPIEQRNYQPYQQPIFNQPPAMSQSMGPISGQNFQNSQGEKTYEPGVPYKAPEIASKPSETDDYPLSPEVMKDFKEKSAR